MVAKVTPPSNIARQEQLVMWSIMALNESNPKGALIEAQNQASFFCEWTRKKNPDGAEIFVGRVVLYLDNDSDLPLGAKPWIAAQDLPLGATIPAYYSTN